MPVILYNEVWLTNEQNTTNHVNKIVDKWKKTKGFSFL